MKTVWHSGVHIKWEKSFPLTLSRFYSAHQKQEERKRKKKNPKINTEIIMITVTVTIYPADTRNCAKTYISSPFSSHREPVAKHYITQWKGQHIEKVNKLMTDPPPQIQESLESDSDHVPMPTAWSALSKKQGGFHGRFTSKATRMTVIWALILLDYSIIRKVIFQIAGLDFETCTMVCLLG